MITVKVDFALPILLLVGILLGFKLTVMQWLSWWWVFSPLLAVAGFIVGILALLVFLFIFALITRPGNMTFNFGSKKIRL